MEAILATLEQELKEIEAEIKEETNSDDGTKQMIKMLMTIPDVGHRIVHHLYLFRAKWQKRATVSKKGNRRLRELLFLGALGGAASLIPLWLAQDLDFPCFD